MAEQLENRIKLDLGVQFITYNPGTGSIHNTNATDRLISDESKDYGIQYFTNIVLAKTAEDIEIIPEVIQGARLVLIRVRTEVMVTAPSVGTFLAKITDAAAGVEQAIVGDYMILRNLESGITSIKLTNNEDNTDGVDLPITVLLGGKN